MTLVQMITGNLAALKEPCSPEQAAWWLTELSALLAPNDIETDTLIRAWRRVRADVQALRQAGRFAPAPLPETVVNAYWQCWEPPDLTGCGKCSEGIVLEDRDGYEYAVPCDCKAGDFRRQQGRR